MGDTGHGSNQGNVDGRTERYDADSAAFHSQLEYLSQAQLQSTHNSNQYGQQAFDMAGMAAALPQASISPMSMRHQFGPNDPPGLLSPASVYQMQQASHFSSGQGMPIDPTMAMRAQQQQQYMQSPYGSLPQQGSMATRPPIHLQSQGYYNQLDPYGFGPNAAQIGPVDPRFMPQGPYSMQPNTSMSSDMSQYSRRASEPASIPSYPRGPPRKPKQSGHALWVGNLPPAATVGDLKDHFSREATKEIESLFLISKSNCAFVNYRSEAACVAAMNRFHDSRFHGVRLVCRLRRGSAVGTGPSAAPIADASGTPSSNDSPAGPATPAVLEEPSSPMIVGSSASSSTTPLAATLSGDSNTSHRPPEKFFVVKSLTVQDLEASVRNGIWATQSHNEEVLNRAFDEADNVYLIFSANKSGEYFGFARMASRIAGEPVSLSSVTAEDESKSQGAPQSIATPATATAPRGRIIDDSARGTIFWEALHSESEDEGSPVKSSAEDAGGQNWGRQFSIEWMSTSRLPFYRTRGLRNSFNSNREIKIARDGTELESTVGRRLIQMFQRPSPGHAQTQPMMQYR